MTTVSVIIPTYNRGYIVERAIKSVLAQSFSDFELLLIDDGSTDNTKSVIEKIKDERIKYIYKPNGGVSSARNMGISQAKGKYVAFLDSDDTWPGNFLQVMISKLSENSEYDVAYTSTIVSKEGRIKNSRDSHRGVSGSISIELFKNSFIWPMTVLIRKAALENFCFDEQLHNSEDNDAFLRLSLKSKFLFVQESKVTRYSSKDAHSELSYISGSCNRGRSLERFYFHLGGDKIVPKSIAYKKISRVYRRAAERHCKGGSRTAAIKLFKKAIKYRPFEARLYVGLVRAFLFSNKQNASASEWQMPEPLRTDIQ